VLGSRKVSGPGGKKISFFWDGRRNNRGTERVKREGLKKSKNNCLDQVPGKR